jgi:hypothetical protein
VDRSTGKTTTKALQANGNLGVYGDIYTWRPGSENTGVIFLNQAGNAYHHWDGNQHSVVGGNMTLHGSLNAQHVNCYSISTQGHYLTTWGMTSHGDTRTWGTAHMGSIYIDSPGPIINMYDNDWGPMYIHHQGENIGFLNSGGGWIHYVNNAGHMWTAQYGWLHDYVNGRANAYAWDAANYRYNQCVTTIRFHHLGDVQHYYNQLQEPWGGAVITGMTGCFVTYYVIGRYRQLHMLIAGGWHAAGY